MLDDYELLYLASERNEEAIEELLKKYYGLICYKATKHTISVQDKDDFINEGVLCFYEAIYNYIDINDTRFITYLNFCLDRRMNNYRKLQNRKKYSILNNSISIENDKISEDTFTDNRNNPELVLLNNENYTLFRKKILEKLNYKEELVFILKEQNFSVKEISKIIDINLINIYNVIKSIRKKTTRIISN